MTSLYVDPDELKKTLAAAGTTFLDDDAENACLAASAGLDLELGRAFGQDQEDVERLYTALDPKSLTVNDLVSLTTLKTDEDGDGTYEITWATTDYVLEPLNASLDSQPYTKINVRPAGTHRFPTRYPGAVEVSGIFGWPSIPFQVIEAAGLIAEQLIQRKRSMPMGFALNGETAAYIIRNDPQINFLLKGLGRRTLLV